MHTLLCGVTMSGKTTLARAIANTLAAKGEAIIVYDPVGTKTAGGNWPASAVLFNNPDDFFAYVARDDVMRAHIFIDEAGELFSVGQKSNHWLLTRGRHFGFAVYLICQRPKMLAPTVRTQCARTYAFRLAPDDMREVFADAGHGPPKDEKELDSGDFYILVSGQSRRDRANVFQLLAQKRAN